MAQFANNFMFAQQQSQQNFSTFQAGNVSPIGGVLGILPAQAPQMSFADPMLQPQMDFHSGMPHDPFSGGFGMGYGDMGGFGMGFGDFQQPMQPFGGQNYQPQQPVYGDPYPPQQGYGGIPPPQPGMDFAPMQPHGWVDPSMSTFPMANNNGWDMAQPTPNWGQPGNFPMPAGGQPGMGMGFDMNYNPGMNPMPGMPGWNNQPEMQGLNAGQMNGKMEVKSKKKK